MNASRSRKAKLPQQLPVMPLRSTAVYPLGVIGVQIGMSATLEMLAAHPEDGLIVAVVVAPGEPDDPIEPHELEKIAVMARVSDRLNLPGGTVQATVQGIRRIRLRSVVERVGYFLAEIEPARERAASEKDAQELIARTLNTLEALAAEVERIPREVPRILRMNLVDPGRFADLVATLTNFTVASKDQILQRLKVKDRLTFAATELEGQLRKVRQMAESGELGEDHGRRPPTGPPSPRRANELRQEIKVLQSELGEVDPVEREVIDVLRRIETAEIPARVATQARSEIERLRMIGAAGPEASDIRSYVDWLLNIPWRRSATNGPAAMQLGNVQESLSDALLGLSEQKERLLDHLAVARLRGDLRGPIPCIVGPPDVGKNSLVAALAKGLGRPLARIELGGRGEAQLVGTRRTRAGAHPGKIAQALRDVRVRDPIIVLAEMDEIGLGKVEGDPIEAMEEVLDLDGRHEFVDRYLDVSFDLGDAMIIAIAQDFYRVPRDLRELMFEIRIAGYTPEEKVGIARERLLPRLIREHGLEDGDLVFPEDSLYFLAYGYARDAGVGMMRRALELLLRTRARAKAQGDGVPWTFDPARIEELLGLPRYIATVAESSPEVGVVTGLAWTAAGGELMFIEALRMPGSGRLIITGLLGDVMRESVNAAYSYVRSRGKALGITEEQFRESDIHVHFPVGAIPKDGPSAGIAVTLAIASTLSNRPVRHDLAMTGEVTLRGKVLEVGGIKEKVLAAHRADLAHVILPKGNERDLRDVPDDVRASTHFHFVERMDDVIRIALVDGKKSRKKTSRPARSKAASVAEPRAAQKGNG
ncbi:MAG: S16 family serine protease [Longimicrobiales bacterium]